LLRVATPASEPRVKYSVYTAADAEDMVHVLADTFTKRDPPAVAAGLTMSDFQDLVRLFCPKAATDGLTIVARSVDTGEMMGVLLTEDSASAMPDGIDRLSARFHPVFDILSQLDAGYRHGQPVNPGESLHLFLLGVNERFGGQGVAQQLVSRCVANGAEKGYRVAITEATNKTSQHIFRKLGFAERVKGSYSDHRFEGRAVFASIAEHGGPMLMTKSLGR